MGRKYSSNIRPNGDRRAKTVTAIVASCAALTAESHEHQQRSCNPYSLSIVWEIRAAVARNSCANTSATPVFLLSTLRQS